eukprot:GFKZ01007300.1.p1 GENE.GFKZ01007300.1~~GFKZ01007300.1.p1  ORF type:complete len:1024 (-),score=100.37 GFKZ01007300.1:925-3912(-)
MSKPQRFAKIRTTHALRVALGSALLAAVALLTPATAGCTTAILFNVSTIAGTPSNYQGSQLRSISLTAVGAALGAALYALVRSITASALPTFFLALPVILAFSALRTEKGLVPLPAMGNVFFGFLLISTEPGRSHLPRVLYTFAIDVALAWAVAIAVTLPFPNRAGDRGRLIVANVLTDMGTALSSVASRAFGMGDEANASYHHFSVYLEEDEFQLYPERKHVMESAKEYLRLMEDLRPSGKTRVSDYEALAASAELFDASRYEPRVLPETAARWRNASAWHNLIQNLKATVHKVSSLESVVGLGSFTCQELRTFFGEAYLPIWKVHLASCAAACQKLGDVMRHATCEEVGLYFNSGQWNTRRADMYFGFLVRYRLGLRYLPDTADIHASRDRFGTCYDSRVVDLQTLDERHQTDEMLGACKKVRSQSGRQALSFFALTTQALTEEIAHVQQSMQDLAKTSDAAGPLAPLAFLISAFPALWQKTKEIATGDMDGWEVKFALTHATLLSGILALSLFLPVVDQFEAAEVAWVYTSAALAAQLSAEPTVFIGAIRVGATVVGTHLAFGLASLLDALGRHSRPGLQYIFIPYIFLIAFISLMLIPERFRYASFLLIVSNAVMIFCPRNTAECTLVLEQQSSECFPNWQYAASRAANVSLGVVFALIFHLLVWPRFANEVALRRLSSVYLNGSRFFGKLHRRYFSFGAQNDSSGSINPSSSSDSASPMGVRESVMSGDVYRKEHTIMAEIPDKVTKPLLSAMLTIKAEAAVWRKGPLKINPLITTIMPDFVALAVSVMEMASILGRRPVYSPSYGRSVFKHHILPMLRLYDTVEVSLHNLVGVTLRAVFDKRRENFGSNASDLYRAIAHLARTRGELRRDAEVRSMEFKKSSALSVANRNPCGSSPVGESADEAFVDLVFDDIGVLRPRKGNRNRRAYSLNDIPGLELNSGRGLCVDDVVLYDAFTFITDGCLSAFVRIAVEVLIDLEDKMKETKDKRR